MYGKTPFVSYTVCVTHAVEKVVGTIAGTVVYNTNISVADVVEAAKFRENCGSFHGGKT